MFFAANNNNNHRNNQQNNNMGGAASTTTTSEQYEEALLLCSPNTRARAPSGSTAMTLMSDFQALSLSEEGKGGDNSMDVDEQCCIYCRKDVYCKICIADINNIRSKMENQPFIYQNKSFCSLDCFFDQYSTKPGLCMWVDSLFSIAVRHAQFQQKSMKK